MAKGRELKGRIRSFENTRKITRTMEMVATSKMKRAQDRVVAARPYAAALREVIASLYSADLAEQFPLLRQPTTVRRAAVLVLTSNRGLAGAFNANLIREARTAGRAARARRRRRSSCTWSDGRASDTSATSAAQWRRRAQTSATGRPWRTPQTLIEGPAAAFTERDARCGLCRLRAIRVRALDAADGRSTPARHSAESRGAVAASRRGARRSRGTATRLHPHAVGRGDSRAAAARLRPQQRVSRAGRDGGC